jgi:CheY-like chemotaxis protein
VKRLILLADDSPTIQRLVTQMFTGGDFEVVSVSNGDAAVRKFEEIHPDLVLADIYMPGKNGYEVCASVKKHPELGDTPVVLLAGAFDAFDDETASQVGAAAHITKPFEPQALISLVSSLAPKEGRSRPAPLPSAMPAPAPAPAAPPVPAAALAMAASAAEEPVAIPEAPLTLVGATAPAVLNEDRLSLVVEERPPVPAPAPIPAPAVEEPPKEPAIPAAAKPAAAERPGTAADGGDLLGLQDLFKPQSAAPVSDAEIERIAQLVIQKLSTQVIENVAWDVVPDITTKVLKEELKRRS